MIIFIDSGVSFVSDVVDMRQMLYKYNVMLWFYENCVATSYGGGTVHCVNETWNVNSYG